MAAKTYKPTCRQCSRPAKKSLDGYFCSLRCAADRAVEGSMDAVWCGKRHEDNPHGDSIGPHGWWDASEERECPECADELEMAEEAAAKQQETAAR